MKDYKLIEKIDKIDLASEVKQQMEQGWQPIGGVAIYQSPGIHKDLVSKTQEEIAMTFYVQAVVKT